MIQIGAVTKGQNGKELADIEGMAKEGCHAISEDGKSVMDASLYSKGNEGCQRMWNLGFLPIARISTWWKAA